MRNLSYALIAMLVVFMLASCAQTTKKPLATLEFSTTQFKTNQFTVVRSTSKEHCGLSLNEALSCKGKGSVKSRIVEPLGSSTCDGLYEELSRVPQDNFCPPDKNPIKQSCGTETCVCYEVICTGGPGSGSGTGTSGGSGDG